MATDATDPARGDALRRRPPLAGVADANELAALERVAAWAPNTRRAYTAAWKRWTAWAAARGMAALPADARHVRAYILDRAAKTPPRPCATCRPPPTTAPTNWRPNHPSAPGRALYTIRPPSTRSVWEKSTQKRLGVSRPSP